MQALIKAPKDFWTGVIYIVAGAATLWLGRNIELGLGDAAQAARYSQRLKNEFPTSEEASRLFEAERAKP